MKNNNGSMRLLSMVLCICMVLSLLPALPMVAEAATTPTYIASIGIAQDGSSGSTGVNDCKSELSGHTIIDRDLNDDAGGDYVYMGYKTTTDPSKAITGIVFRVGENPPNSISYGGATFYLVGGSTESNTAKLGGYIDLNAYAGGVYIYTYITRDTNYGAPLTAMTVNESSSYSGWTTGTNTDGNVIDLNQGAKGDYLYLHYQRFSGKASSTFYYLTSGGSRTSSTTSVSVKNHTQSVSTTPSKSSSVTYDGRTFTFRGWREDNTASSSTVTPSYTYMTSKTYRAVYSATVTLSYNANGGSGAPSRQTATQYINAGSSSVSKTSHSFTIPTTVPTHDNSKCIFLGWSTSSTATTASYQPGQTITISSNTTLYAVWQGEHPDKSYVNNGADHTYLCAVCGKYVTEGHSYDAATRLCACGAINPDAVASVSKNGKVVAAYLSLNDAIQAVKDCTAADEAVITILQDIDLGDSYQASHTGVFTIDLNGFEISSTNSSYGTLYIYGATATIRDSGEDGKITGNYSGIEISSATLTVNSGTISGSKYGVYAYNSDVTISGGTISGDYGVYARSDSTATISGGTISGSTYSVYAESNSTATISGGTISGTSGNRIKTSGVCADSNSTVIISGGEISGYDRGVFPVNSTATISGGTISGGQYGVITSGSSVTISDGEISGGKNGVHAMDNSTVTISGGSISGGDYDIWNSNSTVTLTLDEDGVGATFPGGIKVCLTTLNEILGEGAAYWQGNTMIIPADDATEITGGDVVIKSTCPHTGDKSDYADLKDGANHTYVCSGCNNTLTEVHSYDAATLLCVCGAAHSDAVASVSKNGVVTRAYTTLNDAIQAVRNCTADDEAVVIILKDIALGGSYQRIEGGVFTTDLNGHEISSTKSTYGAVYISGSTTNVTIQGAGENSKITGRYAGIELYNRATLTINGGTISGNRYGVYAYDFSTVTISGGTISGDWYGVYASSSTVTISGGTISGDDCGVYAYSNSTVTITDGAISGDSRGVYASKSTVTISGGSISGGNNDIWNYQSAITLTLGENGVGATFPSGIEVYNTTLNAILGEGAAYWQGNTMIIPADGATEISGGDVVIKATCPHTASKSHYTDLKDGASHTYFCSGCNNTLTEAHSYDATTLLCVCGAIRDDAVAVVSLNGVNIGAYTSLYDVLQPVKNCTADDEAVITLLKDIKLGTGYLPVSSGVFTIDLNGFTLSNTNTLSSAIVVSGENAKLTIIDAGTTGTISGKYKGVEVGKGTVNIMDGNIGGVRISGLGVMNIYGGYFEHQTAVKIEGGRVNISDGTFYSHANSAYCVDASGGQVVISGGSFDARSYAVRAKNCTVTISGGSFTGGVCDINHYEATVTLTVGSSGVGATFPGGIRISQMTLNSILGEGAAYWQGGKQITVADDAEEITGGDVTIMRAGAVATVSKNGIVTGVYTTLNDAIQAVADCTADDEAVITILQDIDLGDSYQRITSGVFTIDLNGHEISSTNSSYGALYISGSTTNVTIQGIGENSKITGNHAGIYMRNNATLTIIAGTISGNQYGVNAGYSTVTISGGTISGDSCGVWTENDSTVTISGGTISGDYGVNAGNSTVTISGGSISGDFYDICNSYSTVTLTLGDNDVGATFPGGIKVSGTTLNAILGEGAAYWQGNTMIIPADGATEISGGDVVIKAECKHSGDKTYTNNGDDHSYFCSSCGTTFTEDHTYTDDSCICGAIVAVASTTVNGVTTYHDTLDAAIQAVANCTAADEAVVTILQDIALGNSYQTISSGVFTIDLNGHEISSTHSSMGVLYLRTDAVNVTIQGAGENSKITGSYDGIELYSATLTINGGTIRGSNHAVRTTGGTVTISGGSLSGGNDCVWADVNSTVTISGGTFSCNSYDLITTDSTITLTLGENGMGATFPGGIMVKGTTLNAILGEDAVYCQGNAMVIPADDATEISRGDVVIKAFCDHSGNVNVDDNDCSTHLVCSVCNLIISYSSDHDYDDNGFCVNCGDYQPAVLKDGWYQITNGGNLFWFAQLVNNKTSDANAVLTNDVDLENRDWIPLGHEIAYEGIIDGAGYTVSGLKVSGNRQYSGFIGQLSNGGVKNLTLSGTVDATCNSAGYVGLMVGHMTDSALYNCSVSGSVKALAHTALYMGGLVGSANHCVIINCGSEADVTLLRGYSDEDAYVGGLAGEVKVGNENPVCLLNSYAVGNITVGTEENPWSGTVHAGGIVGYLRDDAVNNYFYGDIDVHCTGTANVGYAFGYVQGYSYLGIASSEDAPTELIISNNYYPEGKTAVGAGKIYVDGAGQSGIDEGWTTAVSEANIKATSGENALVYILNSNVPYVERIIEEHLGFLSESEWAAIVENIGGKNFAAKMWVVKNGHPVHNEYSGWTEIDGDWYYFDPETGKPVTGITRVPYPATAINGVTYAPNMEDVKYANDKGTLFKDSISAFFVFDENGVFQSGLNGLTSDNRWAVNGCIVWHVGLVQIGEDYYYFIGDSVNGGNKMATGDIYASRNTTGFDMVISGVYTFGADGKLCKYEGIVDLRYYENYRLMIGNGLTKVGDNFIYVDSKGDLIVDTEFYVPANGLGVASGMYTFDENGYLVNPVSTDKDGVYYENGAWYYYENGKLACGKGLISVNTIWHGENAENAYSGYIYVRSSGQLATGDYYITNVSNDTSGLFALGMKVSFNENGIADAPKSGIVDVDGILYYYEQGSIRYGAGLIEHNGGWIYVRSSGKVATGAYWITSTNGQMDAGMYEFGADGYMIITDTEDGIVNDNGVLYYYLDGKKQYGTGLVQLEDGSYIYVRTNGELATGSYWITNHNGLLPEGMYEFSEDGLLTVN